jgi:hypothetical protein
MNLYLPGQYLSNHALSTTDSSVLLILVYHQQQLIRQERNDTISCSIVNNSRITDYFFVLAASSRALSNNDLSVNSTDTTGTLPMTWYKPKRFLSLQFSNGIRITLNIFLNNTQLTFHRLMSGNFTL